MRRVLVLALAVACAHAAHRREPSARFTIDERDGALAASLYRDAASRLGYVTIGGWTSPVRPMWTAFAADVDGDGADEVILGVYSTTHRHDEPEPHRTLWVMRWDGAELVPLFRGSALTRPLVDAQAIAGDRGGRDDVSALERDPGGGCSRARYRWTGFGFGVVAREPDRCRNGDPPADHLEGVE